MRKKLTREEFKEKFDRMMESYNYIPEDGEIIIQCHAPYPDYWFLSNMGYLLSCYKRGITIVKPNPKPTGKKNKDGSRSGRSWEYEYHVKGEKNNRHIDMHKIMAEHFLLNEFETLEDVDIHHIRPKNTFKENEPQFCNRVSNLQALPKSVHKDLTHKYGKTDEEYEEEARKRAEKAGIETKPLPKHMVIHALEMPTLYLTRYSKDHPEDMELTAYPLDKFLKLNKTN